VFGPMILFINTNNESVRVRYQVRFDPDPVPGKINGLQVLDARYVSFADGSARTR
jgi:hypothetical protein